MRGDAALTARLLLRRTGLAGLTVALGGVLALVATTAPWHLAMAEVTMLGEEQARRFASRSGLPSTPAAWGALGLGGVAVWLGARLALDRHPVWARPVLGVVAAGLAAVAALGAVVSPSFDDIAGDAGDQLVRLARRLPAGVELDTWVEVGRGPWLVAIAAALVAAGTLAAREP